MATVRDPVKPEPVAKYETLVETRLAQARGRIRALDLTAAFLGFLIATMAFGLVMALLDRWFNLSTLIRQIAFCVYGVAALAYLGRVIAWPLFRRVNPYYAALQVEHTLPAAKNSVVNWLDLRQQNLPPAIRGAVSHRAAVDISHADLDEAVSPRRALWLGGAAVGLFLAVLAMALFGPGLGRVVQPFSPSNRTEITVVKPEGGNATVSVGRAVSFEVSVQGRRPDSLRFLYRYEQSVPYEERPMELGDSSGQWVITMPAFEVRNGFWYKVAGGDAETEEYRVQVRPTPLITGFEMTYHHRPYTHLPDVSSDDPNLKGLRGTKVQVLARTNRKIRFHESGLVFADTTKDSIHAEPVPGNPQAMQFQLILEKDGSYQIHFTSDEGEKSTDPISYSIKVQPDNPPGVVLTKPEQEMISLPVNEILSLEGFASDDFGVTGFVLRMQTNPKDGAPKEPLPPKPYRPGKSLRLADGSDPMLLGYKDFVELNRVKLANGQPLQPGIVVEYWLEATDNCDFPAPNVGRSRSKFVTIAEPAKDQERVAQQKKQAKEDQQKHEAQQDQQLKEQCQGNNEESQQGQGNNERSQKEGNAQAKEGAKPDQDQKLQATKEKLQEQLRKQEGANGQNAQEGEPQPNQENDQGKGKANPKPENAIGKPQPNGRDDKEPPKEPEAKGNENQAKDSEGLAKTGPPNVKEKPPNEKQAPDDKTGPQDGGGQPKDPGKEPKDDNVKKDENQAKLKPKPNPDDAKKDKKEDSGVKSPTEIKGTPKGSDKNPGQKKDPKGDQGKTQPGVEGAKDKTKPDPAKDKNNPGGRGTEANDPGKKPPQEKANPDAGPDKAKNPKPDKGDNPPGKGEQPKKDPAKADNPDGGSKEETKANPQAKTGKPKDGNGQEQGNGQEPMDKRGADNNPAKPDNKQKEPGQGSDNKDGQTKKEIDNLAKAIKSGDPKARDEARKKLEDLKKNAKEESDRKAAAEALKKAGQENPGADSKNAENSKPGTKPDGKKDGKEGNSGQGEAAKPGSQESTGKKPSDDNAAENRDKKGGQPGEKGKGAADQKGAQKQDASKGEGDQQSKKSGDNPAGNSQGGERWDPANQGSNPEAEPGAEANKEFQKKAGVLQLEEAKKRLKELKEKANDEFLKSAKVSKEELQDYLKYEEERLRRLEAQLKQDDKLRDPKRGGGSLSNLRVRRVLSGEKKDDLPHADKADAPPELREASEEFNQLLAKPERSREKK
jgi:hypothetical protein